MVDHLKVIAMFVGVGLFTWASFATNGLVFFLTFGTIVAAIIYAMLLEIVRA